MYYLCVAPQALKSTHGKTAHNFCTLYSRLHTPMYISHPTGTLHKHQIYVGFQM